MPGGRARAASDRIDHAALGDVEQETCESALLRVKPGEADPQHPYHSFLKDIGALRWVEGIGSRKGEDRLFVEMIEPLPIIIGATLSKPIDKAMLGGYHS